MTQQTRLAAYGVCEVDGQVLLARYVAPDGSRWWTTPGGGVDHGEDPCDAVVRELLEETGYDVVVDELIGVGSHRVPAAERFTHARFGDLHAVFHFYRVHIVGGSLRPEVGGSTDIAQWHPVAAVPTLPRAVNLEMAMDLHRRRPPTGRPEPVVVRGLLHH
jgi:8-oxo-dGTP diphosphatase